MSHTKQLSWREEQAMRKQIVELQRQNAELVKYARHLNGCEHGLQLHAGGLVVTMACSCGLDKAIAGEGK